MDITMPQLGETVLEGTVTRWLKNVGDHLEVGEALVEISTDKVDTEVPATVGGTLVQILVPEGQVVGVGAPIASVEPAGDGAPAQVSAGGGSMRPSPVVRRLAAEHGIDLATVAGTGRDGRVTRQDVEAAVAAAAAGPEPDATPEEVAVEAAPEEVAVEAAPEEVALAIPAIPATVPPAPRPVPDWGGTAVPQPTGPHAYTSVEIDFHRVEGARRAVEEAWRQVEGSPLTILPFVIRALCGAVGEFPQVNATMVGDDLRVAVGVDLVLAVDLDRRGVAAPVLRQAQLKRLRLLAREATDLTARSRSRSLLPDEVTGGTLTVASLETFGTHLTLPVISRPQVTVVAVDGVAKRPVVVQDARGADAIAIRPVGRVTLGWDHRAFDGAYAAQFLRSVKQRIEEGHWAAELE